MLAPLAVGVPLIAPTLATDPVAPIGPGTPCIPWGPAGPTAPGNPCIPFAPAGPVKAAAVTNSVVAI